MICVSGKMTHEISHKGLGFDPTDDSRATSSLTEPGKEPFESYALAQPVEVYTFFRRLALEPVGEGTLERLRGRVLHDRSSSLLADHSTMSLPCE